MGTEDDKPRYQIYKIFSSLACVYGTFVHNLCLGFLLHQVLTRRKALHFILEKASSLYSDGRAHDRLSSSCVFNLC